MWRASQWPWRLATYAAPSSDLIHVCRRLGSVLLVLFRNIFKYGSTTWNEFKDSIQTKQTYHFIKKSMFRAYFLDISTFYVFLGQGFASIGQSLLLLIIFPWSQCHSISKLFLLKRLSMRWVDFSMYQIFLQVREYSDTDYTTKDQRPTRLKKNKDTKVTTLLCSLKGCEFEGAMHAFFAMSKTSR